MSEDLQVWDPGHGGHDSGAVSPYGLKESDVVLTVCQIAYELMNPHYPCMLTRNKDVFVSLTGRAGIANKANAKRFLSVHCNSATNPASGFEVFTSPGETAADPFATDLFDQYRKDFGNLKARLEMGDGDPDKEAKFTVLTKTDMAAALFELEFIHTEWGHEFFSNQDNLELCARSLVMGSLNNLGISFHGSSPSVEAPPGPSPITVSAVKDAARRILDLLG